MKRATKAELRQEIAELRHVGAQMANVCFNLGQLGTDIGRYINQNRPETSELLSTLFRQWDSIRRREGR